MELPQPRYKVTDPGNKHKYHIELPDGITVGPLLSVTTILNVLAKEALIGWAAREAANFFKTEILRLGRGALSPDILDQITKDAAGAHRRKAKDAADLGTKCHDIFEAIMRGKEPEDIPAELAEPAKDFKRWRLSTDIELVAYELAVGSLLYKYGGRLDAVGYSKARGGFGIVDYKTSSGFYGNEYAFQVGGYAQAFFEQYGVQPAWAEIVRFGKKPPYDSEGRPVVDLAMAVNTFLLLTTVVTANKLALIGEPTFTTVKERAAEAGVQAAKKDKSAKKENALGF